MAGSHRGAAQGIDKKTRHIHRPEGNGGAKPEDDADKQLPWQLLQPTPAAQLRCLLIHHRQDGNHQRQQHAISYQSGPETAGIEQREQQCQAKGTNQRVRHRHYPVG